VKWLRFRRFRFKVFTFKHFSVLASTSACSFLLSSENQTWLTISNTELISSVRSKTIKLIKDAFVLRDASFRLKQ